jgi:predicted acylesterase/phospholipase RssA
MDGNVAGLILSGGAAYAAYEVGVIRALFNGQGPSTGYRPLSPQVISGTSAGAFSAALIASTADRGLSSAAEQLADVWLDELADLGDDCGNGVFRFRANPLDAFGLGCARVAAGRQIARLESDGAFLAGNFVERAARFLTTDVSLQQRMLELIDVTAVISTDPFTEVIRRNIRLDRIRSSPIRLLIAAANWKTGKLRLFRNEEMTDAEGHNIVCASAAAPGIFDSVDVGGEPYVDGGVVMNTPLKGAIDAGCDTMHIIYINPDLVRIPLPRVRNTINAMFRALLISLATMANRDLEVARQVNVGLAALQRADQLAAPSEVKAMIKQLSGMVRHLRDASAPYRFLTIHRYSPREMIGGLYRWLSFGRDHLLELMQRGYADALSHDCAESGCVIGGDVAGA